MTYKLIAADIDGTLIPRSGIVSPRILEQITRLRDLGVVFTLATGRSVVSMRRFLDLVGPETPVIAFNGAVIAKASGEILHEQRLSLEYARRVLEIGWTMTPSIAVWAGDKAYTSEFSPDIDWYQSFSGVRIELVSREQLAQIPASKILWFDSSGGMGKILEALRHEDSSGFDCFTSQAHMLEFVGAGVNKGSALRYIAESLGIAREEVIAVGDGMNDLPMLEYAGLGVAMGNANDSLKAAADYVTGTVEDDGLAQVIERFVTSPR